MRPTLLTLACVFLSLLLVACQYVDTERTSEPDTRAAEEESPEPTVTPTPEGPDFSDTAWMKRGRLNVLITGSDVAPDRSGVRTDGMIITSLNVDTGQTILFSVPRNYGDVPLPDAVASTMGMSQYPNMLKNLYEDAQAYPELAEGDSDPGMVALKGAIGELLGLEIDYFAMVDMAGFAELIDAFGGVEVDIQAPIIVRLLSPVEGEGWVQFEIPAGEQKLNGPEALAYARYRTGTTDYDRMERQRCMAIALTEQADLPALLRAFPDLVDVIQANVRTDIPLEMLPDLIMLRDIVQTERILSIGFDPPDYHAGLTSEGYNLPDYEAILQTVEDALADPDSFLDAEVEVSDLDIQHC